MTALLTWSVQVLALTAVGAVAAHTLANAKARLIFWQGLLLALLLLPAIEPWQSSPVVVVPAATSTATTTVSPLPTIAGQTGFRWKSEDWLLVIAAGAVLRMAWIAAGFLRLRAYRRRATLLVDPLLPFDFTATRWYVSDSVPGPVTYGWRRPSILLPARIMELSPALRQAVACHELIHVHRRDWLFVLAEETIRGLLWFHPAVWFVLSRIQLAREQVVDSEVVRLTRDRDCYLDALVEVAAQKLLPDPGGLFHVPAPLFLRKRHLAARVAAVLKEVSMSRPKIAARLAGAASAVLVAARLAIWFVPFVSPAQTVLDDPGVSVEAGATLLHRAPVHHPAGATGVVTLEASLNAKGEVTDARALSGPEDLRKEALTSVLQWHYAPGLSRVQISMRFDPADPTLPSTPAPLPAPRAIVAATQPSPTPRPNLRLASIEFIGFTPEGERQVRDRLPFRDGDTIGPAQLTSISAAASEFDSHAAVTFTPRPAGDGTLEIVAHIRLNSAAAGMPPSGGFAVGSSLAVASSGAAASSGAIRMSNGVTPPRPIFSPQPQMSEEARNAKVQGTVTLSLVVDETGHPTNIKITRPLGMGLDQKAIEAVQQWRFTPGMKDGKPVPVLASAEVNFRLLDNPPQQ